MAEEQQVKEPEVTESSNASSAPSNADLLDELLADSENNSGSEANLSSPTTDGETTDNSANRSSLNSASSQSIDSDSKGPLPDPSFEEVDPNTGSYTFENHTLGSGENQGFSGLGADQPRLLASPKPTETKGHIDRVTEKIGGLLAEREGLLLDGLDVKIADAYLDRWKADANNYFFQLVRLKRRRARLTGSSK